VCGLTVTAGVDAAEERWSVPRTTSPEARATEADVDGCGWSSPMT
jgi:hypothetical protein